MTRATTGAVTISVAGPPGAGKSAVIAALGRAAQSQERALGYRIHDTVHQLNEARAGAPIALPFEPLFDGLPQIKEGGTLTLIETPTTDAIHDSHAQAIVLVCDAIRRGDAADGLHGTLSELRAARSARTEVAGLPVIVALNRCDHLSEQEVAGLEAAIADRLSEFSEARAPAFGDLAVRVFPTACTPEPRGVAEVFAAAMTDGREYRQRQIESRSRLNWTAIGAMTVIALLGCFGAALVVARSPLFVGALALQVEEYRATEGIGAAARLQEPLQPKADTLAAFLADPQFPRLSPAAQSFVRNRLLEIDAYRDFQRRLRLCPRPADARNEDELAEAERCLRDDATMPTEWAFNWKGTDAAVRRRKRLADVAAIRNGIRNAEEWYRQQTAHADQLLHMKGPDGSTLGWPAWNNATTEFLTRSASPPFRPGDPLPQTESLPNDKAPVFVVPLSFARVVQARLDVERLRARLQSLRIMAQALGCFPTPDRSAPLALDDSFSVDKAALVIDEWKALDPEWSKWSPARFSDAAMAALKPQMQNCRARLIDAGRREMVRRVAPAAGQTVVSPAQWRAAGDAFAGAADLRPWRELLLVATQWLDPQAVDPVEALVEFLHREQFKIDLRGLRLTLPAAIQGQAWKPAGPFTISIQRVNSTVETVSFRATDQGTMDAARGTTAYRFAVEGTGTMIDFPGDSIWAEIKVRDPNGGEMALTWWSNGVRTAAFQFDRFDLPPRMHRGDQKPEAGELVSGVAVEFSPDRAWPQLPDLLPALR